jgi:hypothetical protein
MTIARYIAHRSAQAWLSTLDTIRGTSREIFRAILSMVDNRTGESHPRYPITLERIAQTIGRCVQTVSRLIPALEAAGVMIVRRFAPKRQQDGTLRQEPNDYQLVLPAECWRDLTPVESTPAARGPAPQAESVQEPAPVAPESRWSRSVRGRLSESNAAPKVPIARWKLDASEDRTFDGIRFDELAPKLLDAAMLASEGASDDARHRVVVCLNELRTRAHEVALFACNLVLYSWDAVAAVRGWARKCLLDPERRVDSAEHSMNILRKFVQGQYDELYGGVGVERRRREREEASRPMTYSEALAAYHRRGVYESSPPPEEFGYDEE